MAKDPGSTPEPSPRHLVLELRRHADEEAAAEIAQFGQADVAGRRALVFLGQVLAFDEERQVRRPAEAGLYRDLAVEIARRVAIDRLERVVGGRDQIPGAVVVGQAGVEWA